MPYVFVALVQHKDIADVVPVFKLVFKGCVKLLNSAKHGPQVVPCEININYLSFKMISIELFQRSFHQGLAIKYEHRCWY